MKEQNIRLQIDNLWNGLMESVDQINRGQADIILRSEEILMEIDTAIRALKKIVSHHNFEDWADEIHFFKNSKPQFVAIYIYYSKILSIEASKPFADAEALLSYYEKERSNLLFFYNENKDFINYYRRKSTFLDKKYFVRFKFDFKLKLSPELYSYDLDFSTSHDHIVAQIIANDLFEQYLSDKINLESKAVSSLTELKKLEWTASKVALTELLYSLHLSNSFNAGHAELSEIFRWAEKSFNISLGNYHKTLAEIRLRKIERTKFLKLLQQNLNQHLDDLDV